MTARNDGVVLLAVVAMLLVATVLPFAFPLLSTGGPLASGSGGQSVGPTTGLPLESGFPQSADASADADATATLCRNGSATDGVASKANARERLTGQNVSVAIIDPSGFSVEDSRIASNVVTTKSFGHDRGVENRGHSKHGTATATVVSQFVPDADLYLANFDTAYDFRRAVEWAIDRDVDVIVAPVSFYAKPNDGTSPVSTAVAEAAAHGVPVVVPTGNVAQQHWEGTYTAESGRWVSFGENDTRMYLEGTSARIQAWLWWNRSNASTTHDFDVVLYRERGNTTQRVGVSDAYPRGPVGTNQVLFEQVRTNNLLTTTAPNGTYYVRISGPANGTHRVELVTVYHRLEDPTTAGSIVAPGTASDAGVVTVGAYDPNSGDPLALSGRGPTNDGRRGVDLLAPGVVSNTSGVTFTGTSAATAYTGGAVALVKAYDPSLTPRQVERVLEATAYSNDTMAPNASGAGLLDVRRALRCVATE